MEAQLKNKSFKYLNSEELENKVGVVVGTRPGIIKMSPIIKDLRNRAIPNFTINAGQHYSQNMAGNMFRDLNLPKPEYEISSTKNYSLHGEQTAEMLKGIEKILIQEKPKVVLVCADANFNLAGALAARKLRLKLGHVEAGLRSYDWRMPEEHNRVMIDHISDYLFVPTKLAQNNLVKDNVKGKIIYTGNTIVDSLNENKSLALEKSTILSDLKLIPKEYFVLTMHREENVDNKRILSNLILTIEKILDKYNKPVVYPIHPRSYKMAKKFGVLDKMKNMKSLKLIEPLGYLDFLNLLNNAMLVLTDSGGIQEESCILNIPCITLRENTERPETVEVGANIIAGTNEEAIMNAITDMLKRNLSWRNPFGDGNAASKIVNSILNDIKIQN
ncbi:MAG TPA: UDP-N-acetylglucosamine 2-epimerase (non-hydrolyzing) [Bacteroidales bacterium]|nr:UDP-N-acetylglucosamine 2-epimerase (non-hydrolyzing) [Bacteroidales bacterium]